MVLLLLLFLFIFLSDELFVILFNMLGWEGWCWRLEWFIGWIWELIVEGILVVMVDLEGLSWFMEYDWDWYVFGVGCRGIGNGSWELGVFWGLGEVCVKLLLKKEFVVFLGGVVEVGEGSILVKCEGGFFWLVF